MRLASEVLHFNWEWDPLTLLPAREIAEMEQTLKNLSSLHLHHPDLVKLQYLMRLHGAKNASTFGLKPLDLGLQELTGSVSSYFTSFGTGMGLTKMLILIALSYLNCRRADGPSNAPAPGPIIAQAPAVAATPTAPAAASARDISRFPDFPTGLRKWRCRGRSCCGPDSSDEDFSVRYRANCEELEMLRDRYNYDNRPGTDPRSNPKPFGKRNTEDSGTKLPSHHELHDCLRSILT